jgi:hypothetical protein
VRITSSSSAFQILQGLPSFSAPGVVPGDVPLEPADTLVGVLNVAGKASIVLLDVGAYIAMEDDWHFSPYAAIEVNFPPKDVEGAPLVLVTPHGSAQVLAGTADAWEVGRFFARCAEDAVNR